MVSLNAANKEKPEGERNASISQVVLRARAALPEIFAARNITLEREMLAFYLRKAAELPPGQKIDAIEKRFGALQGDARIRAEEDFARALVDSKNLTTAESFSALFEKTPAQLRELNEPVIDFAAEVEAELNATAIAGLGFFRQRVSLSPACLHDDER